MEKPRWMNDHNQRMWDLRHKPRAYEYKIDIPPEGIPLRPETGEMLGTTWGVLFLLLLSALFGEREAKESAGEA
jgi:hypothetical protein